MLGCSSCNKINEAITMMFTLGIKSLNFSSPTCIYSGTWLYSRDKIDSILQKDTPCRRNAKLIFQSCRKNIFLCTVSNFDYSLLLKYSHEARASRFQRINQAGQARAASFFSVAGSLVLFCRFNNTQKSGVKKSRYVIRESWPRRCGGEFLSVGESLREETR